MHRQKLTLLCLCWTILCLDTCGAQSCVDVDCPVLQHCIEEVLNRGACCPTCVRRGCMCEGYQYYDCLSTGFQAGKVPEGKSYFVDFGSTECSCPRGGGKISCRFIPCPEIPANCIDVASPPDGCQQCKRVGCAHGNKKYEAGHSFQMDACQVCHCPNDGGRLMCSPVPGCHTQQRGAKRPASTTTTTTTDDNHHHNNNHPGRDVSRPLDNDRQPNPPPPPGPFSKLAFGNTLPLYKPDPPNGGTGDYDYNTLAAEPTSSTRHQDLPRASRFPEPTGVPPPPADHVTSSSASSSSSSGVHEDRRQELRERQGSHTQARWRGGAGDRRDRSDQTITHAAAAAEEETSSTPLTTTTTAAATTTSTQTLAHRGSTDEEHPRPPPQEAADRPVGRPAELDRALQNSLKDISQAARGRHAGGGGHHHHHRQRDGQWGGSHAGRAAHGGGSSSSSRSSSQGEKKGPEKGSSAPMEGGGGRPGGGEDDDVVRGSSSSSSSSHPAVQFSPTRAPPVNKVGEEEEGDQPRRQAQTLHNYQSSHREADASEPSAKELLTACCDTGEKWASLNGHCNNMELPRADRRSICRTAQRQCCLGSLRETRCLTGVNAARQGAPCDEDGTDTCGADPAKECCRCCSLGLQYRAEGHSCEAPARLDLQCRHAFLSCCQAEEEEEEEEEGTTAGGDGWRTVREKPSLDPTALPKKVSDSPFPKEAFSIGEEEEEQEEQERENAVVQIPPEVEDMDECLLYQGSLCHHRCINTVGSYRCQCFPGYSLQEDGLTCASESADEENRLREDDRVTVEPTALPPAPTTTPAVSPPDPCEENGPCVQQCTPVDGRPHCSCFPGFSQMADGQACADIDECLSSHTCQPNERCVNTEGSYACQRQIACPPGYQVYNDKCEDMDECAQRTDNCGLGFECVNTEGSFSCNPKPRCPAGFSQDVQGHCTDVDECASVSQPCSPGFTCINTAGSYRCQRRVLMCSRGYHASPDAARCIDVDECQGSLHRCGDGQLCHNLPGSYRCDCQTGYQYDSIRRTCVDVNECWRYAGRLCAQTCENSPGSYHCSCTAGFRLAADGKNCEDVNECLSSPCGQECANIYGSYQCYCRAGYYLREDGHTCEDIDECSQSVGHLCTYKCVNVPGSYQCTCPEYGYTMSPNGRSCRDIDECTSGGHNCSLAETCYNIQGGYRCLAFNCPQNYRKVSDTRCERISCPSYVECQNSPLRITYYYLSFQSNILIPAQIFRIGPSPAYSGDNVIISIAAGNEENYFSTRKLNAYTGAVYLNRQVHEPPRDFLVDVEMKLWRQGAFTTFQAKIYVFITANSL